MRNMVSLDSIRTVARKAGWSDGKLIAFLVEVLMEYEAMVHRWLHPETE